MKKLTSKGYENYKKAYQAKVQRLLKKDLFPRERKMLTQTEWENTYQATRNTLVASVKAGKRKAVGNVNQYIVSRQVYTFTLAQAKKLQEASKTAGTKLTLNQIRAGEFDWNIIKRDYELNKAFGMTPEAAALDISQFYFGSL